MEVVEWPAHLARKRVFASAIIYDAYTSKIKIKNLDNFSDCAV